MSRAKVTVTTIIFDEEPLLPAMLRSVQDLADEILIGIDSRTTDRSALIARYYGARVFSFDWHDDFSAARNLGLLRAKGDWILVLDGDDRLTQWGAATIREVLRNPDRRVQGYCLNVANCFSDGTHGQYATTSVRLWRNHQGIRYMGRVHEQPTLQGKILTAGILQGGVALQHLGYDPTIHAMRHKNERNIGLLLKQLAESPDDRLATYQLAHQYRLAGDTKNAAVTARAALRMTGRIAPDQYLELQALALAQTQIETTDAPGYATTALIPKPTR